MNPKLYHLLSDTCEYVVICETLADAIILAEESDCQISGVWNMERDPKFPIAEKVCLPENRYLVAE